MVSAHEEQSMNCPHCRQIVGDQSTFCPHCGKAVLAMVAAPQIVAEDAVAGFGAGRRLQSDEQQKLLKQAFSCLLTVAVLQLIAAGAFISGAMGTRQGADVVVVTLLVIGALFFGLAFWARRHALPAAITGLVVLITLWTLDAAADPVSAGRGLLVKLIIAGVLVRAIRAGVMQRRLERESSSS
jgi:hypothetical protein